jgi:predicted SprT family Zn-dependent metalloprotease
MRLHKKIVYYKNIRPGQEPCKYEASQPGGVNTDIYATIKLDPILRKRKLKPVRAGMMKHEIVEITRWGQGDRYSHRDAERQEPAITRKMGGVKGFWNHVNKMKRKGELK